MVQANGDSQVSTASEANICQEAEFWRRRSEESQALISRLTVRLRGRDRRIRLLELAVSRTVVMHHVWATHLERRLERLPTSPAVRLADSSVSTYDAQAGVVVRLPHLTPTLVALFEVMREHWSSWDPERPPKSSTVARAIDQKLGLKGQPNGEASRSAQTFAAALRPESVNELDARHRSV